MKAIENAVYRRDTRLEGIEVRQVVRSAHRFPDHFHEDVYAIGLMEEGASYCRGSKKEQSLVRAGEIALINPGQVHSGLPADDFQLTYTMLYVDIHSMRQIQSVLGCEGNSLPEFTGMIVRNPGLYALLNMLSRLLGNPGRDFEKESLLTEAFERLLSNYATMKRQPLPGRERHAVKKAKALFSERIDVPISLDDAAGSVGLSRYHFLRVFKKETGVSPHVYRTVKRIEAAKSFIRNGVPFSQVALETGFSDQSHFTNTFRHYMGATPRQYLSGI